MTDDLQSLVDRVRGGSVRDAARLMRRIDDDDPAAVDALELLYPHTGKARIIGITGVPGAGKSTLTSQLIKEYRRRGKTVGVVAIDPTSPFTGGAILGDRVRMQHHATDPGVFIRSLATRGSLGGLSRSTNAVVHVLDAMGYDVIIVETVGVGQDEIDIVKLAHTAVVVLVPGLGDEVQNLKAGIMEIADVFCVNKADRPDSGRLVTQIRGLLNLTLGRVEGWKPPVVRTTATSGKGIAELADKIGEHGASIEGSDAWNERLRARAIAEIEAVVLGSVRRSLVELMHEPRVDREIERTLQRNQAPYEIARSLLRKLGVS